MKKERTDKLQCKNMTVWFSTRKNCVLQGLLQKNLETVSLQTFHFSSFFRTLSIDGSILSSPDEANEL